MAVTKDLRKFHARAAILLARLPTLVQIAGWIKIKGKKTMTVWKWGRRLRLHQHHWHVYSRKRNAHRVSLQLLTWATTAECLVLQSILLIFCQDNHMLVVKYSWHIDACVDCTIYAMCAKERAPHYTHMDKIANELSARSFSSHCLIFAWRWVLVVSI